MTVSTESSGDPDPSKYPYAGWIPTANGHLSFRHIGEARYPTRSVYANVTTTAERFVLGYQRRKLSDVLFRYLVHAIRGLRGTFWFVIAARSIGPPGDSEEIVGAVYIYKSKPDWRGDNEDRIRHAIARLNDLRLDFDSDKDRKIETTFIATEAHLKSSADIHLFFRLNRSGEIYFSEAKFADENGLGYQSVYYARTRGHNFSRWVADQAYFFVRDIGHAHQHHHPSSDTILNLQARGADDRVTWRRNIIYSLQHYIIRSKRFGDAISVTQSAGVLGYCMSFFENCRARLGDEIRKIPDFYDAALSQSLRSRAEEETIKSAATAHEDARTGHVRHYALLFSGIVIALLVMFVQPSIESGRFPELKHLSEVLADSLSSVLGWICIGLLGSFFYRCRAWHMRACT